MKIFSTVDGEIRSSRTSSSSSVFELFKNEVVNIADIDKM